MVLLNRYLILGISTLILSSCEKKGNIDRNYCDFPPPATTLHMFRFIPRDSAGTNLLMSDYDRVSGINIIQSCHQGKTTVDTSRGALRLYTDLAPDHVNMCSVFYLEWKDSDMDTVRVTHEYEQVGCGRSHVIKEFFYNGRKMIPDTAYNDPYILTMNK